EKLARNSFGGHVVCADKQMLIEEAASAYKDSSQVLHELVSAGLAASVVSLAPVITFKNASPAKQTVGRQRQARLQQRGRQR
ncbi:MAG: RtcB family protein, partial [Pseudomonadota bacterium]